MQLNTLSPIEIFVLGLQDDIFAWNSVYYSSGSPKPNPTVSSNLAHNWQVLSFRLATIAYGNNARLSKIKSSAAQI